MAAIHGLGISVLAIQFCSVLQGCSDGGNQNVISDRFNKVCFFFCKGELKEVNHE